MKLKFNFNKRNKYKNICSIEGCNNSACGKFVLIVYLITIFVMVFYVILLFLK